ncbi:MAG: NGG1p interacting factor NIF3 [Gammaproteobacteria bacterium]|nr:NGG1p interacting factor NIF3 [Gammaproteobacteria bacterium]
MLYQIYFYTPESHLEAIKNAMFNVGAGRIGNYDCCCWQVKGAGQFRSLENSEPFIGRKDIAEYVDEYCVEMVCEQEKIAEVIVALKGASRNSFFWTRHPVA